jgi:hypothetical protein
MTAATSPVVTRDTILITHANPEDNTFAIWLASRLTMSGYKVWLDVRTLRGGQDFWRIIDEQLRDHAIKQIVLVSEHISKSGVQKELAMGDARGKKLGDSDFMIPIRLSNVPHGEFPPELIRRNSYDAFPNWAAVLQPLLETLADANVPRGPHFGDRILSDLIVAQEAGRLAVKEQPETLLSNWFELSGKLPTLRLFASAGTASQFESWQKSTGIPLIQHSGLAGTFCDPATFGKAGHNAPSITSRFVIPFNDLVSGSDIDPFPNRNDSRKAAVNLLRQHWDATMKRKGLVPFEYASGQTGWFFPDGLADGAVKLTLPNGQKINRYVSGKFKEKRWHLCLIAQPRHWPRPMLRVHANVALSLDGKTPLPGDQTQKLRMRLTKSWWNNRWRDLLMAGMGWLAEGKSEISLASGDETLSVSAYPLTFDLAVSYDAKERRPDEESATGEIELSDEIDEMNGDGESALEAEDL